jgi:hypothetical protein
MTLRSIPLAGLALLALASCGEPVTETTAPATRVENSALRIALASVPSDCEVARNEGEILELACTSQQETGTVRFEVGPEERGINLVEAANGQREWFESRPQGKFFGNRELVTPGGPAYTARGRYAEDGVGTEENRILTLHPSQDRMLTIRFLYPEGDSETSKRRFDQLLFVTQEVEGLGGGPEGESVELPGEEG